MILPLTFGVCILLALAMRFWSERAESRLIRQTAVLLRTESEGAEEPRPEVVATTLDRTRKTLSAAKLARILSLLVLYPAAVLLIRELTLPDGGRSIFARGTGQAIAGVALTAAMLFLCFYGIHVVARIGTEPQREKDLSPGETPEWMRQPEKSPPVLVLAGWVIWEKVLVAMDWMLARLGASRPAAQLFEQDNEIRLTLQSTSGLLAPADRKPTRERSEEDMIRAITRLDRTLVREIMRPINHVTAIRLSDYTPRRFKELCRKTGYTRIPVYEDQITNLIGYINVYDVLDLDVPPRNLRDLVTSALFVPEVARVDEILQEMIQRRQQVAIVFDEFGGTSGWLSREDIIEEIVGEVEDEFERPVRRFFEVKDGYIVDPATDLDDLREEIGLDLPKSNCDTIAGYVYYRLGRVPRRGEVIEEHGWKIRVATMDNHRIRRLRVTRPEEEPREEPRA